MYYAAAGPKAAGASSELSTTCSEFAIKIFKTSILVFKDRDKYVPFTSQLLSALAPYKTKLRVSSTPSI